MGVPMDFLTMNYLNDFTAMERELLQGLYFVCLSIQQEVEEAFPNRSNANKPRN